MLEHKMHGTAHIFIPAGGGGGLVDHGKRKKILPGAGHKVRVVFFVLVVVGAYSGFLSNSIRSFGNRVSIF